MGQRLQSPELNTEPRRTALRSRPHHIPASSRRQRDSRVKTLHTEATDTAPSQLSTPRDGQSRRPDRTTDEEDAAGDEWSAPEAENGPLALHDTVITEPVPPVGPILEVDRWTGSVRHGGVPNQYRPISESRADAELCAAERRAGANECHMHFTVWTFRIPTERDGSV